MRLKALRADRGLTQEALAAKAHISRVYLARIAGYMGALPHPDGARLAGELCGRADTHTGE